MDPQLPSTTQEVARVELVPSVLAAPLVLVIFYLLRQNALDRKFYREDTAALEIRYAAALAAARAENAVLDKQLDEEQRRRRKAEDDAAMFRRQAGITESAHE